jgi:hypothetical protein
MPVHALLARNHATIVFHGHDHLYARQEVDGVVYQSCPNPADSTYPGIQPRRLSLGRHRA